jgi:hypothetical protein
VPLLVSVFESKRDETKPSKPVLAVHFCKSGYVDAEGIKEAEDRPFFFVSLKVTDGDLNELKELECLQVVDLFKCWTSERPV